MPGQVPDNPLIMHITHKSNLPAIIAEGRLIPMTEVRRRQRGFVSIAHENIQDRRAQKNVPCAAGGCLHDYVPFYFGVLSPMLYANYKGFVQGNPGGQDDIVYLVSRTQMVANAGLRFAFTDGHAVVALTEFYDDLARLGEVDWGVVRQRYWNDTVQDPDRKRRKQAEFLVHQGFPWNLVLGIVVINDTKKREVEAIVAAAEHKPQVAARPDWYY
jgi:hypothetical protein